MTTDGLSAALAAGLERASIELPPETRETLLAYLALLARWNRKINLTAFDLDNVEARAIDRLVIEPVRAAALIRETDRELVDIGSGGGSPVVPLGICCGRLRMTMVEVRERKAAFLREVVRTLSLNAVVEARLFEDVSAGWPGDRPVDLVTCRAVRGDAGLVAGIDRILARDGRVFWFGDVGYMTDYIDTDHSTQYVSSLHVLRRRL